MNKTNIAILAALILGTAVGCVEQGHAKTKHIVRTDGEGEVVCTGGPGVKDLVREGQRFHLKCEDGTSAWVTTYMMFKPDARGWR